MDIEAITIQVQTPPKDDEVETPPEPDDPVESFEMVENPEEEENEGEQVGHAAEIENTREDEIVVEDADPNRNGNHDNESSLSSAPGSDADAETFKSGIYHL